MADSSQKIQMSQEPPLEDPRMRSAWIQLDVRARTVGGIANLTPMDRRLYVQLGRKIGALSENDVREIEAETGDTYDIE